MGTLEAFHRDAPNGAGLKLQQEPKKIHLNLFLLALLLAMLVVWR